MYWATKYDLILLPIHGEYSARKIVLPSRGDLIEKLNIQKGDYALGRPMGTGCPVPHVLQVIEADPVTGLSMTLVVGPKVSWRTRLGCQSLPYGGL
ncbi:MAG: hypothetical protein ACM3X9_13500 [Bacillota bacterium]